MVGVVGEIPRNTGFGLTVIVAPLVGPLMLVLVQLSDKQFTSTTEVKLYVNTPAVEVGTVSVSVPVIVPEPVVVVAVTGAAPLIE